MRALKLRPTTPPKVLTTCEQRGYCGPFANQAYYDQLPGWEGMGDCVHCARTRDVAQQIALRFGSRTAA